jgi:hypothetical protein
LVTQPQGNRPPQLTPEEQNIEYQPPISEGGGNSGGRPKMGNSGSLVKSILISLIVSVVVIFGVYSMGYFVTKGDFTKNLGSVATDIGNITTNSKKTLDTFQTTISDLVDTKVATALKGVPTSAALTAATDTANKAQTTANGLQQTLTQTQNTATSAQQTATKAQSDVTAMKADVEALKNGTNKDAQLAQDIDGLKGRIVVLETKVTALSATPTPTPTSTPTPTPTPNPSTGTGLTATVVPGIFGNITMGYPAVLALGSTNSFQFQLANQSGKTANSIQLIVGFQVMNASNTVTIPLPDNMTASVSLQGYMGSWVRQTGGDKSQLVFSNSTGTGIFASLYNLSQPIGNLTYTVFLTLTSPTDVFNVNYNIIPIVKVVSFTN